MYGFHAKVDNKIKPVKTRQNNCMIKNQKKTHKKTVHVCDTRCFWKVRLFIFQEKNRKHN
jgi:hypothetical protein